MTATSWREIRRPLRPDQRSLTDQLWDLAAIARAQGMYDAEDHLRNVVLAGKHEPARCETCKRIIYSGGCPCY